MLKSRYANYAGNKRKTVKGNDGALTIDVPRNRDGSFEPVLIKKGQTQCVRDVVRCSIFL